MAPNLYPEGVRAALKLLRVRTGGYRIIYDIDDDVLRILVIAVGHRREIYR